MSYNKAPLAHTCTAATLVWMSADDTTLPSLWISSQWTHSSSNHSCEALLWARQGTEAQRMQIKTSKASSLLAPTEVQSNQASKRGSNTGGFHLGHFALCGQFQLIRAWKTGPHILSGCLNTGILPPLPYEQAWVWAKPAWVKVLGCHPLCCHVKARWWDCVRISQGISAAG